MAAALLIWPAVVVAGVVRDGYIALTMTAMMESMGVGRPLCRHGAGSCAVTTAGE